MSTGVELACVAMADDVPKRWGVARCRFFFPRDAPRSLLLWPCACKAHETAARGAPEGAARGRSGRSACGAFGRGGLCRQFDGIRFFDAHAVEAAIDENEVQGEEDTR